MNATVKSSPPKDWRTDEGTLVFAIGNSGRQDDGLGWAFGERLAASDDFQGTLAFRYQLQIEDADLLRTYHRVIFVDASKEDLPTGVAWSPLEAAGEVAFSTHALSPGTVLRLAEELYDVRPEAWTLAIAGKEWELCIGLSEVAERHLELAWASI